MNKDCYISIKGMQFYDSDEENGSIELFTQGKYSQKNGDYYITYKESQATGMEGVTTTLKIEGSRRVTLIRSGAQRSQLIVENGKRHLSHYDTGFGGLMIGVSGANILSTLNQDGGELEFDYTLDINSSLASKNKMFITVKSPS
jgi:uncharacterized beta-barrel protein YwiB (DUF1934 family)